MISITIPRMAVGPLYQHTWVRTWEFPKIMGPSLDPKMVTPILKTNKNGPQRQDCKQKIAKLPVNTPASPAFLSMPR